MGLKGVKIIQARFRDDLAFNELEGVGIPQGDHKSTSLDESCLKEQQYIA